MVKSFGNRLALELFDNELSRATRRFPKELVRPGRRKLLYLHEAAELKDLQAPPGNRLKLLRGTMKGLFSIRINDQWRIVFRWENGHAFDVRVVDYH